MPAIDVNGFQMSFEDRGDGEPLLLLHGGMGIGADWRHVFPDDPDAQIRALYDMTRSFATSVDDMAFRDADLSGISARALIVHGDRDPFYPVELAVEMFRGIPGSSLWIVPNGGHGPIFGALAAPFRSAALAYLEDDLSTN